MAIKSIFERFADEFDRSSKREVDFATAYSNAATQRANAQRMFEDSLRQEDANKRMWAQEGRLDDTYQNYTRQSNAFLLDDLFRRDAVGTAKLPGDLAVNQFNSTVLGRMNTTENADKRVEVEMNQLQKNLDLSRAWGLMTQQEKDLIAKNPHLATLLSSTITQEGLTPEAAKRRADTAKFSDDFLQKMLGGSSTTPLGTESLNAPNQSFAPYAAPLTIGAGSGASTTQQGMVGYVPRRSTNEKTNPVAGMAGNSQNKAAGQSNVKIPTYEGWMAANRAKEQVIANSRNMSPEYQYIYLSNRVPELDKEIEFNSNYARY